MTPSLLLCAALSSAPPPPVEAPKPPAKLYSDSHGQFLRLTTRAYRRSDFVRDGRLYQLDPWASHRVPAPIYAAVVFLVDPPEGLP